MMLSTTTMTTPTKSSMTTIRQACDALITDPGEINRALLRALAQAAELD